MQRTDGQSRDCTQRKWKTTLGPTTKKQKTVDICRLPKHIGADKVFVKNLFKMIGSVPSDDEYEVVKSIVDFNEKAINVKG